MIHEIKMNLKSGDWRSLTDTSFGLCGHVLDRYFNMERHPSLITTLRVSDEPFEGSIPAQIIIWQPMQHMVASRVRVKRHLFDLFEPVAQWVIENYDVDAGETRSTVDLHISLTQE